MAKVQFNCRLEPEIVKWIDEQAEAQSEKQGKRVSQADIVTQLVLGQPFKVKPTKEHKAAAERRAADPLAAALERDDIDYMKPDELPSAGSIGAAVGRYIDEANRDLNRPPHMSVANWRAGRKPLLKPGEKK